MSQHVFVVIGAKGGTGATSLAMKLVEALPATGARVIVDADLAGKRSVAVLCDVGADLDRGRVAGRPAIATTGIGLVVMELARSYEDGFLQTPASVLTAIAAFPTDALVVVDAPQPFAATVRHFTVRATRIIVITEPTLVGMAGASAMLAAMNRFGIDTTRVSVVLNHARGNSELQRADIERTLRAAIGVELPNMRDENFPGVFSDFVGQLAEAVTR